MAVVTGNQMQIKISACNGRDLIRHGKVSTNDQFIGYILLRELFRTQECLLIKNQLAWWDISQLYLSILVNILVATCVLGFISRLGKILYLYWSITMTYCPDNSMQTFSCSDSVSPYVSKVLRTVYSLKSMHI